jgi:hypothetical protein
MSNSILVSCVKSEGQSCKQGDIRLERSLVLLNVFYRLKESMGNIYGPDPAKARADYASIVGKGKVNVLTKFKLSRNHTLLVVSIP